MSAIPVCLSGAGRRSSGNDTESTENADEQDTVEVVMTGATSYMFLPECYILTKNGQRKQLNNGLCNGMCQKETRQKEKRNRKIQI